MLRASTIALCIALLSACVAQVPGSDSNEPQASSEEALGLSKPHLCRPERCGPPLGLPNTLCPDGVTTAGPTGRCIHEEHGGCGWEVISCPAVACPSSASCAAGEYCTVEDGDCNKAPGCKRGGVCPALCYGVCKPRPTRGPFCGGIAGIPCPGMGRCADDPTDSCDPNNGGADCGGICSCIETVLCVRGSHFNNDPTVCTCVPDAVQCGNRTCGAGQICCSPSCGICGNAGGLCPQIACVNPL